MWPSFGYFNIALTLRPLHFFCAWYFLWTFWLILNEKVFKKILFRRFSYFPSRELSWLQRICYSHWANGLIMGWFPLSNGVSLIMKKAPSDSPIWQLKKRELLLPLSFLITKLLKLDLSNLHYDPHYRTQGCVMRENNITTPLRTPLTTPLRIL